MTVPPGTCVVASAAGTATVHGILRSLRARWGDALRLVAADINPPQLVAASAIADAAHTLPLAAAPEFPAAVIELLRGEHATVWWPVLDAEVVVAARLRDRGDLPEGVRVLAPPRAAAELCLDKLQTAQRLETLGLPTPPTVPAEEAHWRPGGLVLKPREGFGSRGLTVVDDPRHLAACAAPGLIAQPRLTGPEVTVDALRTRDGATRAVARERLEVKAGVCTKARVYEDDALGALAGRLADGLGLTGPFCFQLIAGLITDVNPRPGAGTRMTVACGVDLHAAALADALGMPPVPLRRLEREHVVVRHWEEVVR